MKGQKSLNVKINVSPGSSNGKLTVGEFPQSRAVAQNVQRQDDVEERDSHPQCDICSQPKNRPVPTTSVHLVPATGFNLFQHEMDTLALWKLLEK